MSDNLQDRGPADPARVNETHEVRYRTQEFNCDAKQLRAAVAKAGVMADAVERELRNRAAQFTNTLNTYLFTPPHLSTS